MSVSIPAAGWWADYGSSVAGADCSIKIGSEAEVELGDVQHDYADVGFPFWNPRKEKTFDTDLTQTQNDITRTYTIGETLDMWCEVGVGSSISDLVWDLYLLSPVVEGNEQTIDSVEVEEHDDAFEIE